MGVLAGANKINLGADKREKRVSVPNSETLLELVGQVPVPHHKFMFPVEREIVNDLKRRAHRSVKFARLLAECELTRKSFHRVRHRCITRWAKEGKTLESIAQTVRHRKTETTKGGT